MWQMTTFVAKHCESLPKVLEMLKSRPKFLEFGLVWLEIRILIMATKRSKSHTVDRRDIAEKEKPWAEPENISFSRKPC